MLCSGEGAQLGLGIEQQEDRIDLSQQVVKRLGLQQRIDILHGDHFALPLADRDNSPWT